MSPSKKKSHSQAPSDDPFLSSALPDSGRPATDGDGRFRMREIIGRGAHFTVTKAYDTRHRRMVALLTPKAENILREDMAQLMCRAKELCQKLGSYDNIGQTLEVIDSPDYETVIQVMELGEENLQAYVNRRGALMLREAMGIADNFCAGMSAAHQAGILVCDIKQANVVRFGTVWKLVDFTLARNADGEDNDILDFLFDGSPGGARACLPPEQAERPCGRSWSEPQDVYGMGLLLAVLVVPDVARLLTEPSDARRAERIRDAVEKAEDLPPLLRKHISGCLAPDPARRTPNAVEVYEGLQLVFKSHPEIAPGSPVDTTARGAGKPGRNGHTPASKAAGRPATSSRRGPASADVNGAVCIELQTILLDPGALSPMDKLALFERAKLRCPDHPSIDIAKTLVEADFDRYNSLVEGARNAVYREDYASALDCVHQAAALLPDGEGIAKARDILERVLQSSRFLKKEADTAKMASNIAEHQRYLSSLNTFLSGRALQLIEEMCAALCKMEPWERKK